MVRGPPPGSEGPSRPGFHVSSLHPLCPPAPDVNSRSARVLFLLVVPGHLVFLYTISCMQGGHTTLTLIFIVFYMTAALLQVGTRGTGGRGPGVARQTLCHRCVCGWVPDKHWAGLGEHRW